MSHRRLRYLFLALFLPAASLGAQATVIGTVTDSVSHRPVVDALIQLVGSGTFVKSATSDSLGAYRIADVPPGA